MQIFKKDDKTFDIESMTAESRWSYYISSYVMRDWTEGVTHRIQWPFLRRNLPKDLDSEEDYGQAYLPQWNEDGLIIRIAMNNYHILYEPGTTDWWVHDHQVRQRGMTGAEALRQLRKRGFEERFVHNAKWMSDLSQEDVDGCIESYANMINGEPKSTRHKVEGGRASMDANDKVMTGA